MGADAVFNTKDPDFLDKVTQYTGGRGFGYVFETAGNPITIQLAYQLAGNKSHICCIGTPHTPVTFTAAQWELMNRKECYVTGSWMSYSAPFPGKEWSLCARFLANGQLKFDPSFIHKRYAMSQAGDAFAEYHHPENVHGKIMLLSEDLV
jgi:L-iditol 2-dehydrogenase